MCISLECCHLWQRLVKDTTRFRVHVEVAVLQAAYLAGLRTIAKLKLAVCTHASLLNEQTLCATRYDAIVDGTQFIQI